MKYQDTAITFWNRCCFVLLFGLISIPAYASIKPTDAAQEVLVNPGFEEWDSSYMETSGLSAQQAPDGNPTGWFPGISGDATISKDSTIRHSGVASVKINSRDPEGGGDILQFIRVLPNQRYKICLWVRLGDVDIAHGPGLWFTANLGPDGDKFYTNQKVAGFKTDQLARDEWVPIELEVESGDDTRLLRLRLSFFQATGTIWLDDVVIEEIPNP